MTVEPSQGLPDLAASRKCPSRNEPLRPFAPPPGTPLPTKPASKPPAFFGFPMNLNSKAGLQAVISEEPADHVWQAIMDCDSTGQKWGGSTPGAPEAVMR